MQHQDVSGANRPTGFGLEWWRWGLLGLVILMVAVVVVWPALRRARLASEPLPQVRVDWTRFAAPRYPTPLKDGGTLPEVLPQQVSPSKAPTVLYIGSEWCPYCAAERWPLVIALSRFGNWIRLDSSRSAAWDSFPDTATWTFFHSKYHSRYLSLATVELAKRTHSSSGKLIPLQTPSAAEKMLWHSLDPGDSIPFLLIGSRYRWTGAGYSPALLANLTWSQIIQAIRGQTGTGRAIMSNANLLTAALCLADGGQPAQTCQVPIVKADENVLEHLKP